MDSPDSGSRHDPSARLPPQMWSRPLKITPVRCRACGSSPVGDKDSPMYQVSAPDGSADLAGVLVCRICDRVGAPA